MFLNLLAVRWISLTQYVLGSNSLSSYLDAKSGTFSMVFDIVHGYAALRQYYVVYRPA